jgi:beta-N-acetylhexosaminidase
VVSDKALLSLEGAIGQKLLLAFAGKQGVTAELLEALRRYRPAGVTLFRSMNVDSPAQVRVLCQDLQQAAQEAGLPHLLIAADQEGGQLMAVGEGVTQLPGNMALGATGDVQLARRAGEVLGRELAAMGINVDYAPCCDVNVNPRNPGIGIRSFGEDPQQVAAFCAAMIAGIQSAGVAATAKHFPGLGDTVVDPHWGAPVVPHTLERLRRVELPPFEAAVEAGVRLVMTAHVALPAVDGNAETLATLSPAVLGGLLRRQLGYQGVIVTDAMDMGAIRQGEALGEQAVRAVQAGVDLLLMGANAEDHQRVHERLWQAAQDGRFEGEALRRSAGRVLALKDWLQQAGPQPDLSVVGCAEHRAVADEIAARSLTLVRDRDGLLPLRLPADQRLAFVLPRPADLTPADTSSYVTPTLAQALRRYHPRAEEFLVSHAPGGQEIADLLAQLAGFDCIVLGTLNAFSQPQQAEMVKAILATGIPTVVAALRLPYDLAAFPQASTFAATYSLLEPSMHALAAALFGQAGFPGRLPVSIPEIAPAGFGVGRMSIFQ